MEPPPSLPLAMGTSPPETAADDPPEEPPGVRVGSHGLPVAPCSLERVWFTDPNSGEVVWAVSTAPAARSRDTRVVSFSATRSAKTRDASV